MVLTDIYFAVEGGVMGEHARSGLLSNDKKGLPQLFQGEG